MSNIINFNGYTTNDVDPNNVLDGAKDQCNKVIVLGNCADGDFYCASSTANKGELLHMIETFKFKLMRGDFE